MKPISITMQGFGSYIHPTTVDFSALGESPIFLITGTTGSGKTTILDAMCFALYCKATGGRRSWASMRSTAAEDSLSTSVDFCFSLGKEVYRFCRSQTVYYVRGSGRRDIKEEHLCYRLVSGEPANKTAQWQLILSGSESKIRDYAQQLLGLTCEQFSQVIVLPQGDFLKLLRANSKGKAEILQTLFSTQIWSQITDKMKQYTNTLLQEVGQLHASKTALLEQEETETIEELNEKCKQLAAILKDSQAELQLLQATVKQQIEQLNQAKALKQRFEQQNQLTVKQQQLQQLSPSIEEKKKTLAFANKIEHVYPYWQNYHNAQKTLVEKQTLHQLAEQTLQEAKQQLGILNEQQDSIVQKKVHISKLEQTIPNLERALQLTERIEALKSEQNIITKTIENGQIEQNKIESQIALIEEKIQTGTLYLQSIEKELQQLPSYIEQLHTLEGYHQQLQLLKQAQTEHTQAKEQFNICSNIKQQKEKLLQDTKEQVSALQAKVMKHTAAHMAKELKENTPCPVCGSLHHPSPFSSNATHHVSTSQLTELTDKLEQLQTDYQQYLSVYSHAQAVLEEKNHNLTDYTEKCTQIPFDIQALLLKLNEQRKKIEQAEHTINLRTKAEERIQQRKQELSVLQQTRDAQKENTIQQQQQLASIKATIAELQSDTESLQTTPEIKKRLTEARNDLQALQKETTHWDAQFLQATSQLAAKETNAEYARLAYTECKEKKNESQQVFEEQLTLACLSETVSISSNIASMRISTQEIQMLEEQIQSYTTQIQAVKEQLEHLTVQLQGKTMPQIEHLEEQLLQKQTQQNTMAQQVGIQTQHLHTSQKALEQLYAITTHSKEAEDLYEQASRLSQLLSGVNQKKIPLQQFVLGIMLDDILTYANEFFSLLSRGRYSLKRLEGTTGGNAKSGLDLEVLDGFTGAPRSIETLSGGEQFLASLSLAFGLSDVVQSYSGSVQLDSIFIDEGFGSLDQDTLDTAMKAFSQIQKMGRTVGIISHVSELKNRIVTQICVHPSKNGGSKITVIKDV